MTQEAHPADPRPTGDNIMKETARVLQEIQKITAERLTHEKAGVYKHDLKRADVEALCPSLKPLTGAQFAAAILRMETAHLLNGHYPEATRIASAVEYLKSLA